jgi:NAD(P)H-hydrate epimerase
VLVVGGDHGFSGAVRLAAEAAARVGAGLVSVATRADQAMILNLTRPELMVHGVENPASLDALLDRATVVAIGPGLGQSSWGLALLERVLTTELPLIVDADALNLLGETPCVRHNWVLTPHPGEAGRLLGMTSQDIQRDRFTAIGALQSRYGGTIVLKGSGTLILTADGIADICGAGNPGMASGGMGDVLTGVIAGLIAQNIHPAEAARFGVCLHAAAGDLAARDGERGLLASDLLGKLRGLINGPAADDR